MSGAHASLFGGWSTAWPSLAAFGFASLVLAATPGPGVLYIVTRTLAQGRRAGLASVMGVAVGNLGNAMGASLGLAALLAVSTFAFTIIKFAGAAYLVYLGVRALRTPLRNARLNIEEAPHLLGIFRDGFFVALLNPKTALFFAAFLPQFIDPNGSAIAQSAMFGAGFVAIACCTDSAYVLAAKIAAPALTNMKGAGAIARYATTAVYFGLAVLTATSASSPATRK